MFAAGPQRQLAISGCSLSANRVAHWTTRPTHLTPPKGRFRGTAAVRPNDRPTSGIGARRPSPSKLDRQHPVSSGCSRSVGQCQLMAGASADQFDATLLTFKVTSDRPVWREQFGEPAVSGRPLAVVHGRQLPRWLKALVVLPPASVLLGGAVVALRLRHRFVDRTAQNENADDQCVTNRSNQRTAQP